uniref:Uncharacterized protein n=1 Tax=Odontella aurita TaxID=265563 RepID=A0A7S4JCW9_9STRA|mmetsp:Transcript_4393/g.12282  ORF Transcript_4393/g.12282 Transcript_4393/m.12282 type:complete len:259 (+) Transcript_4393:133-909(+)
MKTNSRSVAMWIVVATLFVSTPASAFSPTHGVSGNIFLSPAAWGGMPQIAGAAAQRAKSTALNDGGIMAGIAAASAIAGFAAGGMQGGGGIEAGGLKKENAKLRDELKQTKDEFDAVKVEYSRQLEEKEEALFKMDEEFEDQTVQIRADLEVEYEKKVEKTTATMKNQFDRQLKRERRALEGQAEVRLEEQGGKLRQAFLEEKMAYEVEFNDKKQRETIMALEKQSNLLSENSELKEALDAIKADLESIMGGTKGKMS